MAEHLAASRQALSYAVSFGQPLSMADFMRQPRQDPAAELAGELMRRVIASVTVLPVPLVAAALGADATISRDDLQARSLALAGNLAGLGAVLHLPHGSAERAAEAGISALLLRDEGGRLAVPPRNAAVLAFYAAAIGQLEATLAPKAPELPEKPVPKPRKSPPTAKKKLVTRAVSGK